MNLGLFSRPILRLEVDSEDAYMDLTEHGSIEIIATLKLGGQPEPEQDVVTNNATD